MYTAQKNPAALRSQEAGVGSKTFCRNFERKEDVVELERLHAFAIGQRTSEKMEI